MECRCKWHRLSWIYPCLVHAVLQQHYECTSLNKHVLLVTCTLPVMEHVLPVTSTSSVWVLIESVTGLGCDSQ